MQLDPLQPQPHESDITFSVEFYPSVDDQVHVALRIGGSVNTDTIATKAYQLFLIINVIAFPAFLLLQQYVFWAASVFVLNLAAIFLLIPRVNSDSHKKYYSQLYGNRENVPARVDLTNEGILYTADGGYSFWPWNRIDSIEETNESIYFYFDGNGFAVRKSGFAYDEQKKLFLDFAYAQVHATKKPMLSE